MDGDEYFKLVEKVREILLHDWDPIGVADVVNAKDEYNGYVLHVVSMLRDKRAPQEIETYLMSVVTDRMELTPNVGQTNKAVNKLIRL